MPSLKTLLILALPVLFGMSACISSSNPSPPAHNTTIVVPQGSQAVCSDGTAGPCH